MWVCCFGGWCFLVWPAWPGEQNKARAACRQLHAARVLPRCPAAAPPSKTPPKSRYWLKCISPKLTAKGGHRPGQLLSGIRRTDAFPANPGWGLAQESPSKLVYSAFRARYDGPNPAPRQHIEDLGPSICSDGAFVPTVTVGRLGDHRECP